MKKIRVCLLVITLAVLVVGTTFATGAAEQGSQAQAFPDGPITLIVPFAAGGGMDVTARGLIDEIEAGSLDLMVANKKTVGTVFWFPVEPWIVLDNVHVARETHPVFGAPVETQLDEIQSYPFTTYHTLRTRSGYGLSAIARLTLPSMRLPTHAMEPPRTPSRLPGLLLTQAHTLRTVDRLASIPLAPMPNKA